VDSPNLRYGQLNDFEKAAVRFCKANRILRKPDRQLLLHNDDKVLAYQKGNAVLAFNFHPEKSFDGYFVPMPEAGVYQVQFSTDDFCFGGFGRIFHQPYETVLQDGKTGIRLYLPSRTAVALKKIR
jgi:1,4-alpha-glucan branching enzyme